MVQGKQLKAGEGFAIGGIPCMICVKCGVCREAARFWTPSRTHKPAAACEAVCSYCR
jgi:hypothetical protein